MAHPNEELLRSLYGAFASRDIEAASALMTDDIAFHQPGNNVTSGDYHGKHEVLGLLRQLGELTGGTFRSEVHDVLANDVHAIGLLKISAQRESKSIDVPVVHVIHIRDGRVAEVWPHPIDINVLDDFWGR